MSNIEGTYTIIRGQKDVELYERMGVRKEAATKLIGARLYMSIWEDSPKKWGFYFTCDEAPQFNRLEFGEEGVDLEVDIPIFVRNSKLLFTRDGDVFDTKITSEGSEYTCKEIYSEAGVKMVYTFKDKTFEEFWERTKVWSGSFSTVANHNLEEYFGAFGDEFVQEIRKYKATFWQIGNEFKFIEYFGGAGTVFSTLKLNEEVPFYVPGEDITVPTDRRSLLTKKGIFSYVMTVKNPDGSIEDWTFDFSGNRVKLSGFERNSKTECWMELEKHVDMTGTFKTVAVQGLDEFTKAVGIEPQVLKKVNEDARLIIKDLGDGWYSHESKSSVHSATIKFKLGEQFEFFHPLLNENIKGIDILEGNVLKEVFQTSKGEIKTSFTFKDSFIIEKLHHVDANVHYTVIIEKC